MAISDLQILEKRIVKLDKIKKSGDKEALREYEIVNEIIDLLNKNESLNINANFEKNDLQIVKRLNLISTKPMMYVLNYGTTSIEEEKASQLKEAILRRGDSYIEIYGLLENEIRDLDDEDKKLFLKEYDISETGLRVLINKAYSMLNLITFYTAGPKETRAWSIMNNSTAPTAAGKIHSDFQKGFIRAEIIDYSDYIELGSEEEAKNKGLIRSEGKDYIVKDGDIVHFRYNV